MSAEVKILVKGFTNADSIDETGEEKTQATVTLIKEGDFIMVVDPGILESQQVLVDALKREGLTIDDVDVVCVTHSHIDHYRNVGMFPEAKVLDYFGLWEKNTVEKWQEQLSENIQILRTPGHDNTDITIFVTTNPDCEYPGVIAICGDVFWKNNFPRDPAEDIYALNPIELGHSREMVLKTADWIIPGHGDIYKVDKSQIEEEEPMLGVIGVKKPSVVLECKKCKRTMEKHDRCLCRPWLCHHCCQCGLDCNLCGCSHKKQL